MNPKILIPIVLGTCLIFHGCAIAPPKIQDSDPDIQSAADVIMARRVQLPKGFKSYWIIINGGETYTSSFGKDGETPNLDCVVSGIREVISEATIIYPSEFWKYVEEDIEFLPLSHLLEDRNSDINKLLALDYVIIVNHQKEINCLMTEMLLQGSTDCSSHETVNATVVDMNSKHVIEKSQITYEDKWGFGHALIIPIWTSKHPAETCKLAGQHAAESILRSQPTNKAPRIAVVAGANNFMDVKFLRNPVIYTYCRDADSGRADAQTSLGDIYFYGLHDIRKDFAQAYAWYSLAANNGNARAAYQLKNVEKELSPEQLNEAQRRQHQWEPGQCERNLRKDSQPNNE